MTGQQLDHCPKHWRHACYPRACDPPAKPQSSQPPSQHNILYLVDEHDMSNKPNGKVSRTDIPVRRYVWHHSSANLETFNIGEKPDVVNVHEFIANPQVNKFFRWEGYMFDVPGSQATCRVAIAAGAAGATDASLSGPVKSGDIAIDRVVGFAGTYCSNAIPIGPVCQVRRDDSYRRLHSFKQGGANIAWHCAYYITRETPKKTSGGFTGFNTAAADGNGGPDEAPAQQDEATVAYNAMMDENVDDNEPTVDGQQAWGGQVFGFTIPDDLPAGNDDDGALQPYQDDALKELQND